MLSLSTNQEMQTRFPKPSEQEVKDADRVVEQLAKDEIFSLSTKDLAIFVWDIFKRGHAKDFSYYDSNPEWLSPEQAEMPATILLHGYGTNQGEWLPLLRSIRNYKENSLKICGPVFTLRYPQSSTKEDLIIRIKEIKDIYQKAGKKFVIINLVGHSLGGITSVQYGFDTNSWVEGTKVEKVISIAGRLRNVEPPVKTPFYAYCSPLLPFIDTIWQQVQNNREVVKLYAIAAENDWLLPLESVLVGSDPAENKIIANAGHALIPRKEETLETVINFLFK